MTGEGVFVKFGAETGELKTGMEQGANEVRRATGAMSDSFKSMASNIKASMSQVTQNVGHSAKESTEKLEGFAGAINGLRSKFLLLGEVLAAGWIGEKIFSTGERFAELSEQIVLTAQKTGMTTDQVQELGFAASLSGSSAEAMAGAMRKLSLMTVEAKNGSAAAVAAFRNVGISQEEVKNSSPHEILMKIADAYKNSADDANKTANAVQLLGRAGMELIPTLNKGSDGINELAGRARELGIILDKDTIEKGDQAKEKFEVLHMAMGALGNRIGADMIPALSSMAGAFAESSKEGGLFNGIGKKIGEGIIVLTKIFTTASNVVVAFGMTLGAIAAIVAHPSQAKTIWNQWNGDIDALQKKQDAFFASLDKNRASADSGSSDGGGGGSGHIGGDNGSKSKAAKDQIAVWKAALEQKKEDENQYFKDSLQDDIAFWESKLNVVKKGSKEERAVRHELYTLHKQEAQQELAEKIGNIQYQMTLAKGDTAEKVALAKQEADLIKATYGDKSRQYIAELRKVEEAERQHKETMARLEQEKADAAKQAALSRVETERETLRYQKEMGDISETQELQGLRNLKEQEYQIELKAAQDKAALITGDVVARQKAMDQIQQMAEKHTLEMTKLDHDYSLAVRDDWRNLLQPISSAFNTSIKGMIQGTLTFQKAMSGIAQAILASFVDLGVKMVADWAARQAAKMLITSGTAAQETAVQSTAHAAQMVQQKMLGVAGVMSNAAIAATAAMASVAAIPFYGWAMAPAVGASTYGMAMGYLASAEGGYDVPDGVNPLTQLHKREMVLPAKQADVIRNMADNGGGMGDVHIHARSDSDVIHVRDLKKLLVKMHRNFELVTS